MAGKLQFAFKYVASSSDKKSSVIIITSITTEDNRKYLLPEDLKYASNHTELIKTDNFKRIKKSFNQRGQERIIWITCTEAMKEIYFDEDGNILFNDQYLEQILDSPITMESTQKETTKINLKHIAERFMLEKFSCKHSNAQHWLETFEKECTRFEITVDNTKIEVLRLFLDKACLDWHSATLTTLTSKAGWDEWRKKFLETFADKGWSSGIYALSYRYIDGSLMEYAMKKEKILLDMDPDIGTQTLVMLIVAGLPEFIRNKIDRDNCSNTTELLHEIRKCESFVNKSSFIKKKVERQEFKRKNEEKKPCKNCEKLNKGTRYHPENSCWFKKRYENEDRVIGSNSVIEVNLNTEQKNE